MATMTAPIRSTPGLTIPPTQNTAPVFEYRCLYTHDVRKKKKTWHDGSLRFHTFNRRVMVYDDAKNYIGDLHHRESDQLSEGDELRLDKGVLVEVGEQIGRTETDLAPILEKARPQKSSSPPRAPLRKLPPTNATTGTPPCLSGRPKSIADVLGASQGPIGRARLPTQSPYEQRQQTMASAQGNQDHPSKRRRLHLGKENEKPHERQRLQEKSKIELPREHAARAPTSHQQAKQTPRKPSRAENVVEISSNDEPEPSKFPIVSRTECHRPEIVPSRQQEVSNSASPRVSQSTTAQIYPPIGGSGGRERPQSPPCGIRPSKGLVGASKRSDLSLKRQPCPDSTKASASQRTGRLRFAPSKPRVKLIYPILVASRSSSSTGRKSSEPIQVQSNSSPKEPCKSFSPRSRRRTARLIRLDSSSDVDLEDENPQKSPTRSNAAQQKTPSPASLTGGSSPLFCPTTPPSDDRSGLQQTPVYDELDFSTIGSLDLDSPKPPFLPDRTAIDKQDSRSAGNQSKDHAPPSKLTLMDRQLYAPISLPKSADTSIKLHSPPKTTKLRRTQSANDADIRPESSPDACQAPQALPSPQPQPQPRDELKLAQPIQPASHQPQKPFKQPRKLQKSVSDSAAAAVPPNAAVRPPLLNRMGAAPIATAVGSREQNDDRGPWSKAEAFDLFDFWPPGMEKPVYGDGSEKHPRPPERDRGFLSDKLDGI